MDEALASRVYGFRVFPFCALRVLKYEGFENLKPYALKPEALKPEALKPETLKP